MRFKKVILKINLVPVQDFCKLLSEEVQCTLHGHSNAFKEESVLSSGEMAQFVIGPQAKVHSLHAKGKRDFG